jgi:hypothetical protein
MDANFTNLNTDKYQEGSAIGATTPAAGAFTTLSASSTVSGTGFSTYLASPPAIGGTAAAAGKFTTLESTGTASLGTASAQYMQVVGDANYPALKAAGSGANIPAIVQPKGTGALQAQQTDSTATGGNARGANAVDWQTTRNAASNVASGLASTISGGAANLATAQYSNVSGGVGNTASGYIAGVGSGYINTSGGYYAYIGGGQSNASNGYYNFIGGGFTNSGTSSSAVTTQSGTMNGTTAVTLSGSNGSIKVGQYIIGTSIAGDTYVAAISGTSLTLSKVASGSSTSTLSFFTPHGVVVGGGNNQATGSYSFIGGGGDAGTAGNRNVASGDWSFVGGGFKNVASALYSTVVGGYGNTSNNIAAFVGGGGFAFGSVLVNAAQGQSSGVVSGIQNTAAGNASFIGAGYANVMNGQYSASIGGSFGIARSIVGNHVFAANVNPIAQASGITQSALLVLARQTTDATATILASDANAASTTNQVILPNNSAYAFRGTVIANVTGGGNTKAWAIEGAIKRGAGVGSTALVGSPMVTSAYADVGAATWAITATADTTNGGLAITFTGQAATTIRVVAKLETTEVTF